MLGGFKCSISLPIVVNAMYCAGVPDEPANKAHMLTYLYIGPKTKRSRPGLAGLHAAPLHYNVFKCVNGYS